MDNTRHRFFYQTQRLLVSRLQKIKPTCRFRNLQTIPKPPYSCQGFSEAQILRRAICPKQQKLKKNLEINDIFSKTKPSSFPQRLKVDGRVYSPTKLIADALNHSFVTSAQTNFTSTGPSKTTDTNIKKYLLPRQANSIFLSPTTPEEILTLFNGLDSKKSCGHDDIPVRTLKLSKYLLAPLL